MMQSRLHSFQFKIEPAEASAKPTGAEPFVSRGRSKQRSFLWFVPRFREGSISSMGIISLLLEREGLYLKIVGIKLVLRSI